MSSYEEMYEKLLALGEARPPLILPSPIENVIPVIGAGEQLTEHDRLIQDFYRIMENAAQGESQPSHRLKKTA